MKISETEASSAYNKSLKSVFNFLAILLGQRPKSQNNSKQIK